MYSYSDVYDGAGSMTSSNDPVVMGNWIFTPESDGDGRICAVPSSGAGGEPVLTGYLYNAEGERVSKGSITAWSCDAGVNTPLHTLMLDHFHALEVQHYSEFTVRGREGHIGFFLAWLEERGITEAIDVTRLVLERYQRYLFHYRKTNARVSKAWAMRPTDTPPVGQLPFLSRGR